MDPRTGDIIFVTHNKPIKVIIDIYIYNTQYSPNLLELRILMTTTIIVVTSNLLRIAYHASARDYRLHADRLPRQVVCPVCTVCPADRLYYTVASDTTDTRTVRLGGRLNRMPL